MASEINSVSFVGNKNHYAIFTINGNNWFMEQILKLERNLKFEGLPKAEN